MVETVHASDTGVGISLLFGVITVFATLAVLATSYISVVTDDHGMQVLSGIALAVALLAGGLTVAAVHVFGD
jgi:hypothetical protein